MNFNIVSFKVKFSTMAKFKIHNFLLVAKSNKAPVSKGMFSVTGLQNGEGYS